MNRTNLEDSNYISIRGFLYFIAYKKSLSIVEVVEWLLSKNYHQTINTYEKDKENGAYKTSEDLYTVNNHVLKKILDLGLIKFLEDTEREEEKYISELYYKIDALNRSSVLRELNLNFYQANDFGYTHNLDDTVTSFSDESIVETTSLFGKQAINIDEAIEGWKESIENSKVIISDLKDKIEQQENKMVEMVTKQGYLDPNNKFFSIEMKLCHDTWNELYKNGNNSRVGHTTQVENYLKSYDDFTVNTKAIKRIATITNPKAKLAITTSKEG